MDQPLKVLFFIDYLFTGGIQTLVEDILRFNDNSKMSIELLTLDDGNIYPLHKKLANQGVTIHQLPSTILNTPFAFITYLKKINTFFRNNHDYDVVHLHTGSKNFFILMIAKHWGIPVRVAHSHNTGYQSKNKISIWIGNILKHFYSKYSNLKLGCSENACDWMFGKNSVSNGKSYPISNAIDYKKFIFSSTIRNNLRQELGIQNKIVFGHIGRLTKQKNHSFLLDVFSCYKKRNQNFALLLIGDGNLENELKDKAKAMGIEENVIFLGYKSNQNEYLQAMDYFVFPSLFEGFGTVAIEAQAADLYVYASKYIPKSVDFTGNVLFLEIDNPQNWAKVLPTNMPESRKDISDQVISAKLDIQSYIQQLSSHYNQVLHR